MAQTVLAALIMEDTKREMFAGSDMWMDFTGCHIHNAEYVDG